MSQSRRTSRMASLIRSELARVLTQDVSDPSLREVVITDVELSTDLKHAKVFFARGNQDPKEVDKGLKRASPFLKRKIGEDLQLRYVPTLEFRPDAHSENVGRLMRLFDDIHKASN